MSKHPIKVANWLEDHYRELQRNPDYITEGILLEITLQICEELDKQQMSRAELARKMGWSRSAVTKLLRGNHNISVRRLVEVALALGLTLTTPQLVPVDGDRISPICAEAQWVPPKAWAEEPIERAITPGLGNSPGDERNFAVPPRDDRVFDSVITRSFEVENPMRDVEENLEPMLG